MSFSPLHKKKTLINIQSIKTITERGGCVETGRIQKKKQVL